MIQWLLVVTFHVVGVQPRIAAFDSWDNCQHAAGLVKSLTLGPRPHPTVSCVAVHKPTFM